MLISDQMLDQMRGQMSFPPQNAEQETRSSAKKSGDDEIE